jgi:hypothetical protein
MRLFLLLIPLAFVAACSPRGPACAVPMTDLIASDWLEGEWTVQDHEQETEGNIVFAGDRVETVWADVTLRGRWAEVEFGPNALSVRLTIDEALEGDVRIRYGLFDEVELTLVFAGPNQLYALQGEGVWTRWDRVIPPLP